MVPELSVLTAGVVIAEGYTHPGQERRRLVR